MGLESPAFTVVDNIPLGRRLEELKKEKGAYYSTAAMSARLGIHEETLRSKLKGKRELYSFELEKIAKDLKMSVERVLQCDIREDTERLSNALNARTNPTEFIDISKKLVDRANGLSERCHALHRLGKTFLLCYRFNESTSILTQVHQLAIQMQKLYGDSETLYLVMHNLMESFTAQKDFESASRILDEITPFFVGTPIRYSAVSYQKAMIEESKGNLVSAQKFAMESLNHALESDTPILISKAIFNLAHFEFRLHNYEKAEKLLEESFKGFDEDVRSRLMVRKEIVKTLLKQGKNERALIELENAFVEAREINWQDMIGKLSILLTVATNEPKHALAILDDTTNSIRIRSLACKCLQDHYKRQNDGQLYLHYSRVAEQLCIDFSDILDEGEL